MSARGCRLLAGALAAALLAGSCGYAAGFPGLDRLDKIGRKAKEIGDQADKAGRVVKGATGLSLEEEIAIGDAVALEIVGKYGGLSRDEAATRRVNLIGRALGRYALRQDLVWRFAILNSEAINAFSAPGGRVFITQGLYNMLQSDDELAGVLAHEIAHIDDRHALKIIARGELLAGLSDIVSDRSQDFAQYEQVVGDITKGILENGYDPNTEFDADKRARELARVTGFAPGGLRVVIEALKKHQAADRSREVFSTHPSADERLRRLPWDPAPANQ